MATNIQSPDHSTKTMAIELVDEKPVSALEEGKEKGDLEALDDIPLEEQRRILRKIDLRVTAVTGMMFCISLMDRTNLGAASIAGMTKELHLNVGNRYNLIALMFFVTYILFELPGAVFARTVGIRVFLGSICTLWGVVMCCFGLVTNWQQLVGLRVLLGLFEAGYFPACVYLLSTWYTRYEVQKRFAFFWIISTGASAFSGILAYGLMQMHGIAGKSGWRWIFIMEGVLTVIVGLIGFVILVDFPDKLAKKKKAFLNPEQLQWIIRRLEIDRGDSEAEPFSLKKFLGAGKDLQLYFFGIIFTCLTTVAYCISFFLPIILNRHMGFSIAKSQCLVAPPYVFAGFLTFFCGWAGDKYRMRSPLVIMNCVITIVGLTVMTWGGSPGVRYFGIFLTTGGTTANVPTAIAWQTNNLRGQWSRAFGSAILVGFGGLGGISGSLIFRSQDAPRYLNGIYGCLVANGLIMTIVAGLVFHFSRQNRLCREGKVVIKGHPGFFYTL